MKTAHCYDFDNLSFGDKLELFAQSPLVRQFAEQMPAQGLRTKRALTTTVGTLVVGLASILAGSDRRADAELRYLWPILRPVLVKAGLEVADEPVTTQHFRDYRRRFVTGEVLASLHSAFRRQAVDLVKVLGLLKDQGEPLLSPSVSQLVFGDGAWFTPASDVGRMKRRHKGNEKGKVAPHPSRSKYGCPRIVDYDSRGKAYGYNHVTLYARSEAPRLRVVLSLLAAPGGNELDAMDEELDRLVAAFGDGLRGFVYDGAMAGAHHRVYRKRGLLTINLPKGMDSREDWGKGLDKVVGNAGHVITVHLAQGCTHHLNVAYGSFYQLERDALGRWVRRRVLEHTDVRRIKTDDGYRWELDVKIHCEGGTVHTWTVDPNGHLASDKGTVNLVERLRIITPHSGEPFSVLYGVRNNAEAHNRLIRTDWAMGDRARSYARKDHELDRLLVCLLNNALVLAEHGPKAFQMTRSPVLRAPINSTS